MDAEMEELARHAPAVRAVAQDKTGVPQCPDKALIQAEAAGLVAFKSWPSGHWTLTPKGRGLRADLGLY